MKKFIKFLHDSREELRKVTWPDRDEVTSFTGVVVVTVVFISIFLWMVDSALMTLVRIVIK